MIALYVNVRLPLNWRAGSSSRQPRPLIGPYFCNAFANLNVCLKFEHGLRFKSLYLALLFAMSVKKGFADERSNSG